MRVEIRGLTHAELKTNNDLVYAAFRQYATTTPRLANPLWDLWTSECDPHLDPQTVRALFVGGEMVSTAHIYTRQIHLAGQRAKVGCIGNVATHPQHRERGYAARILEDCQAYMRQHGYAFSFLFGNERVYRPRGWQFLSSFDLVVWPVPRLSDPEVTVRPSHPETDVAVLARLYDAFNAVLTGPVVRSPEYWRRWILSGNVHDLVGTYFVIEHHGRALGYFQHANDGRITEYAWDRGRPEELPRFLAGVWQAVGERNELTFTGVPAEVIDLLKRDALAPDAGRHHERGRRLTLNEQARSLWWYVDSPANPAREWWPEVRDTVSLIRFLRTHDYVFWMPADCF